MRALQKMAWIELKLFLRQPMAAFFTLVFPLIGLRLRRDRPRQPEDPATEPAVAPL